MNQLGTLNSKLVFDIYWLCLWLQNALFEMMFAEDTIFDVVGCLEFEPGAQQPKKHREYLKRMAKYVFVSFLGAVASFLIYLLTKKGTELTLFFAIYGQWTSIQFKGYNG